MKDSYTLLLDMKGMERWYFCVNGVNMGRYWLNKWTVTLCNVTTIYHNLMDKGNLLVLFEDLATDPTHSVQLVQSTITM